MTIDMAPLREAELDLAEHLARATAATDLPSTVRPLLDALGLLSGLESTYLTRIAWARGVQEISFARNVGDLEIGEGLEVPWDDTVCRRALESETWCTESVQHEWPDAAAGRDLGIHTYVTQPVRLDDGTVYGTLCGASASRRRVNATTRRLMELFARLIADQIAKEHATALSEARARAAEERLRARAELLAIAEHELKTPLAVLCGWTDILAKSDDSITTEDRAAGIESMRRAAQRLQKQIERMLEEARAEITARQLELETLDVGREVGDVATAFAGAHGGRSFSIDSDVCVHAAVDRDAMYQVLGHLLENAVKYTAPGGHITVRTTADDDDVLIEIVDDGEGIPDHVNVFQAFARGSATGAGVGLGLHIVHTLVEAMGGSVSARRNVGPGSTFAVRLPRAR